MMLNHLLRDVQPCGPGSLSWADDVSQVLRQFMKGTRLGGAGLNLRDPTGDFRIPFRFRGDDVFGGDALQDCTCKKHLLFRKEFIRELSDLFVGAAHEAILAPSALAGESGGNEQRCNREPRGGWHREIREGGLMQ